MSVLTLDTAGTIAGVAGSASAITVTIFGDEKGTANSYEPLYQGQLPSSVATLYTVPASSQALISTIIGVNTTAGAVTATLSVNGTAAGNRIFNASIPAGGSFNWAANGWTVLDANGAVVTTSNVTLTGDVTGSGPGIVPTTLATVNANVGSFGTAGNVGQFTVNAKGLTTAAANVPIAITPAQVTGFDTQVRTNRLDQMAAPTADVSMNGHKITTLQDGSNTQDAVTFGQLQAAVESRNDKDAVLWGTTGAITLSGLGTQGNGEWTGTLTANDRILVKNQASSAANGIYLAAAGAWTRSLDANTGAEITNATVLVQAGATLKGDTWRQSLVVTTIGTDPQTWVQIGEGDPITLTNVGAVPNAQGASLAGQALTLQPANGSFPGLLAAADFTKLGNQSGTNTGDVSLAAVGAVANANAATLTGQVLNLQPASASFPGVITAAQFTKLANTSGTNSGDVTLTAVGAAPNANAASLSGQALTIQPASASFPGVITSAQFVVLSNTSGTNTGDVSLTAVGAVPNANGASLVGQTLTLQPANGSNPGLLSAAGFTNLSNQSGTNTGNVSLGAVGASPNANAATLTGQALNLELASASFPGVISAAQFTKLANTSGTNSGDVTLTAAGTSPNANAATLTGQALTLQPASASFPGNMTALDFQKLANAWIDVTANSTALVLTTNTGAQNVTALNAILTAAPAGSTIFFPGGTYNFNAKISVPAKQFTFQGHGSYLSGGYTILAWNSVVGDDLILLTNAIWGSQFRDLTFVSAGVTQSAGAVININGNAYTNIFNCTFSTTGGGFLFDVLKGDKVGSGINDQSWNSSIISGCIMNNFKGRGIFVNSGASSLVVEKCVINGAWGGFTGSPSALQAVAGIEGRWVGALQISLCDVLGCINNLLLDPVAANSEVCASVFCTNVYMDNSAGSCVKIAGTGATVRCRFDTCSFTTAGTNYTVAGTNLSAVELAGSFAYPVGGQGIDFVNCNVQNTFSTTGTTNGFLITNGADFSIGNSKISPWTNGINVTPIASAGRTQCVINNNVIGPAGGFAGNVTGILLNAGAATYGSMNIEGNTLEGNTTAPMTDNSTIAVGSVKKITGNVGYMAGLGALPLNNSGGAAVIVGRGAVTSGTGLTHLFGTKIPANAVPVGQLFRVTASIQPSAASAMVINVTAGPGGAAADTIISTISNTPAANGWTMLTALVEVVALGASNTVAGQSVITTGAVVASKTAAAEALSSAPTTAAWYISVVASIASGTATVKGATIEAL